MKPLGFEFEKKILKQGYSVVVGCDEVGRGALAGPIVAVAIIFDFQKLVSEGHDWTRQVQDSKLIKAREREELVFHIKQNCLAWSVAVVSPSAIDKINIHEANLRVLHRAIISVSKKIPSPLQKKIFVVVDGRFTVPHWKGEQEAVVHGDAKIFSIAAASILAKVYRDAFMMKQAVKFPKYGFEVHKGYGTGGHRSAILENGLSLIHRKTFCKKIDAWAMKQI